MPQSSAPCTTLDREVRRHLTYANVVSTICLFIVLGGGAYAAGQLSGSQLRDRSVSGLKLRMNTLGTNEIKETRLGRVPLAASAANADRVDGLDADQFLRAGALGAGGGFSRFAMPSGAGPHTLLTMGDLTLTAACNPDAAGGVTLTAARTSADPGAIRLTRVNSGNSASYNGGYTEATFTAQSQSFNGTLTYRRQGAGVLVSATFTGEHAPGLGCQFEGVALHSPG